MRKRPNLADLAMQDEADPVRTVVEAPVQEKALPKTVYLHPAVLEQIELLCLQERPTRGKRKKFNTLMLEAVDLLFQDRGLPCMADLIREG